MSAVSTTTEPETDTLLWRRQWRSAVEAVAAPGTPRAFVVGTAGSGKTSLLRRLHSELRREKRDVTLFDASGASGSRVPASHVVLVDDLHLLPHERLAEIRDRADDTGSALIVAARPWPLTGASRAIARQLERDRPSIVLGHVSRADLLSPAAGTALAPRCVDLILEATAGVSWLVAAALDWHDDIDCADDPAHLDLIGMLCEQVAHRLELVPSGVRRLIEARAVSNRFIDTDENRDVVRESHAEGLLLRDGRPIPVVRTTVREAMPARRFVDLGAGGRELAADRAQSLWRSGRIDDAGALVDAAIEESGPDDGLADLSAAIWSARGMMAHAHTLYRAYPPSGHESTARAAIAAVCTGHPLDDTASAPATSAPTALRSALAGVRDALAATLGDRPDPQVVTDLVRATELYTASRTSDPVPELPAVVAAAAALHLGDTATARAVLDDALDGHHGGSWARRRLLLWTAWTAVHEVRPGAAEHALELAAAEAGPTSPRDRLLAHAVRVALARRYQDETALTAAWQNARPGLLRVDIDLLLLLPLGELVCAAVKVGDARSVERPFAQALEIVAQLGEPGLWSPHVHWAGIQRGILASQPSSLTSHARALVSAGRTSPVAAAMARAGRVWTSVLAGTVDPDAVEESARALAAIGLTWDAARLAGHGAARTDDRRIGARLLACARELHPNDPGRGAATPAGTTPDAESTHADAVEDVLSEREREVARLVLQGKTYAEIGETIFISPRTVEHHIAHIRRRIDAQSRSEMIAKLRLLMDRSSGEKGASTGSPLSAPGRPDDEVGVSPDDRNPREG